MKRSTRNQALIAGVCVAALAHAATASAQRSSGTHDQLTFQTHSAWSPRTNIPADEVMVYGIDKSLPARIASWRSHGYRVTVMTGVAWGEYQSYLDGGFDGQKHWDDAQTSSDGHLVLHGESKTIPYMVPSLAYGRFLTQGILAALDAGAEAIYLEEPEFWARSGWSPTFKSEWQDFYHEPWQAPDSSPDAQYRASKLKYMLYRRALGQVIDAVHAYAKAHGRSIPCNVATHSLLNYARWNIVSPESSLIDVGIDGYIAQVWTGTARTPNFLDGQKAERTFETAFLEYGAMQNLVRASHRRVWYLNDPIEDNPNHSWDDYRRNWESTLTASLLQPEVSSFEVLPWPERIFGPRSLYPSAENTTVASTARRPTNMEGRVPIPAAYASELQAVFHSLSELPDARSHWDAAGTSGIGILVSDTLMFQRAQPHPSDPALSAFHGMALPLLTRGVPVEPVQIESAAPELLNRYKVLLLTYQGQKPPSPGFHDALNTWVRRGGSLLVVDDDKDPYLTAHDWWNTGDKHFATPRQELFLKLGVPQDFAGTRAVGSGTLTRVTASPVAYALRQGGADEMRALVKAASTVTGQSWKESDALVLHRGRLVVAAGLSGARASTRLSGTYLDLFDAALPVLHGTEIAPGQHRLLLDITGKSAAGPPEIVAASARTEVVATARRSFTFRSQGIEATEAVVRISNPHPAASVTVDGHRLPADALSNDDGIVGLRYINSATPQLVTVVFAP